MKKTGGEIHSDAATHNSSIEIITISTHLKRHIVLADFAIQDQTTQSSSLSS